MKLKKSFYEASGMEPYDMQNHHTIVNGLGRLVASFPDDSEQSREESYEIICAVNLREDCIKALEAACDRMEEWTMHETNCATNSMEAIEEAASYGCTCGLHDQIGQTRNLITQLKSKVP